MRKAEVEARVQRAVCGFRIPMMSIPKLYDQLAAAVKDGKADDELKAIVAGFPGVVAA